MMFTQLFAWMLAEGSSNKGIPWWVWVILIVILLIILWFWFGREEEEELSDTKRSIEVPVDSFALKTDNLPVEEVVTEAGTVVAPDDLKKIEGIGPKVASLLNQAGIMTFQQMVDAGAEKLEKILDEASLQMIDADTWPEQARLAAAGDWDGLKELQGKLKGGKRV